jgi:SAM-dependent methyltransferase
MLRFRVGGDLDLGRFLETGRRTAAAIRESVVLRGDVLDFGCGCGRTLRWLIPDCPDVRFAGTDVDAEAVAWCRAHLRAQFAVNGPLPPLAFPNASFDVVYAISILTHLDEPYQRAWIREWRRILRPGGALLLTYHGASTWNILTAEDIGHLQRHGFLFRRSAKLHGICPEWYHTAFQSEVWTRELLAGAFDRVETLPGRFGYQDAVLVTSG